MFWRVQGEEHASAIEKILDRDDFTLEELLLEEDVIQEVKSLNERLINYLNDVEIVLQLLSYIVNPYENVEKIRRQQSLSEAERENEEDSPTQVESQFEEVTRQELNKDDQDCAHDEDEGDRNEETSQMVLGIAHKVCEIFCCEVDEIFTTVVSEAHRVLNYLFAFLDQAKPLNNVMTGYFSRIMISLIQHRPVQVAEYISEHPELVKNLVMHIYNYSISEFILHIIGLEEQNTVYEGETSDWLCESQLLDLLLKCIAEHDCKDREGDLNSVRNAAFCLIGISNTSSSALSASLKSPEYLQKLLLLVNRDTTEHVFVAVIDIFIAMLTPRHAKQALSPEALLPFGSYSPVNTEEKVDETTVYTANILMEKLEELCFMLGCKQEGMKFVTSYGEVPTRLGSKRWKILDLISKLIQIVDPEKCVTICKGGILKTSYSLLCEMPFNSVLHNMVQSIVFGLLNTENKEVISTMLIEKKFHHWLVETESEITPENFKLNKDKPLRAGYYGVVTTIANQIRDICMQDFDLIKVLESDTKWREWVESVLVPTNKTEDPMSWSCGRPPDVSDIFGSVGDMGDSGSLVFSSYSGVNSFSSDNDRYNDYGDDKDDEDEDEDEDGVYMNDNVEVITSFQNFCTDNEERASNTVDLCSTTDGQSEMEKSDNFGSALDLNDDNVVLVSSPEAKTWAVEEQLQNISLEPKAKEGTSGKDNAPAEFNAVNFWKPTISLDLLEEM